MASFKPKEVVTILSKLGGGAMKQTKKTLPNKSIFKNREKEARFWEEHFDNEFAGGKPSKVTFAKNLSETLNIRLESSKEAIRKIDKLRLSLLQRKDFTSPDKKIDLEALLNKSKSDLK